MNKKRKKLYVLFFAVLLTFSINVPMLKVEAVGVNRAIEVPVDFQNSNWADYENNLSKSELCIARLPIGKMDSENYQVNFKFYIPKKFLNSKSVICFNSYFSFFEKNSGEYIGSVSLPNAEFRANGNITTYDSVLNEHIPMNLGTVETSGQYYVFKYNGTGSKKIKEGKEQVRGDMTATLLVNIKGIKAKTKGNTYFDDLKIVGDNGEEVLTQNFNSNVSHSGSVSTYTDETHVDIRTLLNIVKIPDGKTLTVKQKKIIVKVGKTSKITATISPKGKITYTSSNKKIASVDSKGIVKGKKAGKAVISIKGNGKTVKVTVIVKK